MMRFILVILSLFICQFAFAQLITPDENIQKNNLPKIFQNIEVEQDPMLDNMLNWHIENNRIKNKIDGFRVEIFFSSDQDAKEKALKIKEDFLETYPEFNIQNVHVKYISPNFRVRVGDFRTKNEALKLYKEIKDTYRVAFIVADAIDFPLKKQIEYERPN
jgi:hypothetical protein